MKLIIYRWNRQMELADGGERLAISLALIIFLGLICDYLLGKIKLPGLVGMLFVGIALGPHMLNLLDPALLE
ncbi:MAG TPA: hypothetical protein ENI12_03670 [Nitrospirae bacterium]|nr:hypothetical protein [Nitrospirota bacterium]